MNRAVRLLLVAGSLGCTAHAEPHTPQGRQLIVAMDLSASRTPRQIEDAGVLLSGVAGQLGPGDRLVMLKTYESSSDAAGRWVTELKPVLAPSRLTAHERKQVERVRAAVRNGIQIFLDTSEMRRTQTTDIFRTLYVASEYARERPGLPTTLLLLSDMRQSTPGQDMERGWLPTAEWVDQAWRQQLIPRLDNVCVVVVGADTRTPFAARVRGFWLTYLKRGGARIESNGYRYLVTSPSEIRC